MKSESQSSTDLDNKHGNGNQLNDCSISKQIWSLRYTYSDRDFASVVGILSARQNKLNLNIEKLKKEKEFIRKIYESEKLAKIDIQKELNELKSKYSDLKRMNSCLNQDKRVACEGETRAAEKCNLLEVTKADIQEELNKLKQECSDLRKMNSFLSAAKHVAYEREKIAEERCKLLEVTNVRIQEELKKWKDECLVSRQMNARLTEEKKVACETEHQAEERCKKLLDISKEVEEEDKRIIVELTRKIFEVEGKKEKAESKLKFWKTKFEGLETRVLRLEEEYGLVMNTTDETDCRGNHIDLEVHAGPSRISPDKAIGTLAGAVNMTDESGAGGTGCCGNNIDLEVHAGPPRISPDEAISNLAGAATERHSPPSIFEIIDSDDYSSTEGTMGGKEKNLQGLAEEAISDEIAVENGTGMLKRKDDPCQQIDENGIDDDNCVKRHKVSVLSGSNNTERFFIPQRQDSAIMRPCENSLRIDIENRNLLLDGLSDSDDSSSSSDSEDDLPSDFDFTVFMRKD